MFSSSRVVNFPPHLSTNLLTAHTVGAKTTDTDYKINTTKVNKQEFANLNSNSISFRLSVTVSNTSLKYTNVVGIVKLCDFVLKAAADPIQNPLKQGDSLNDADMNRQIPMPNNLEPQPQQSPENTVIKKPEYSDAAKRRDELVDEDQGGEVGHGPLNPIQEPVAHPLQVGLLLVFYF